jgi:hypothetical protein
VALADQEPNDDAVTARPAPSSLSWDGVGSWGGDDDWYTLPPSGGPEPLRITLSDPDGSVRLSTGDAQLSLDRDEDGAFVATDAPVGVPLELVVGALGPYHVEISGGGLTPVAKPDPLPLDVSWELPEAPAAATTGRGQQLDGELTHE